VLLDVQNSTNTLTNQSLKNNYNSSTSVNNRDMYETF